MSKCTGKCKTPRCFLNNDVLTAVSQAETAKQANPKWIRYFQIMFQFLSRVCYNIYHWDNLPDSMDARFLEMCLMQDGCAGLIDHSTLGPINLRATWGELGIYGVPVKSTFYSIGDSIHKEVDVSRASTNAVLVLNNADGEGYIMTALDYAKRLADCMITHDINIDAQRTPVLLDGEFSQLEQVMKAYIMYAGGSPVIPTRTRKSKVSEEISNTIKAVKTEAPFVADKVHSSFLNIIHEFYTLVGINYANNQKSERMIVDEVNANNNEIMLAAISGLNTRREAAEQYNRIHGTEIAVHLAVNPFGIPKDMFQDVEMLVPKGMVEVQGEEMVTVNEEEGTENEE